MTIYSGFTHKKWWFSIAMLNYQRVFIKMFNYLAKTYNRFVFKNGGYPRKRHSPRDFFGVPHFETNTRWHMHKLSYGKEGFFAEKTSYNYMDPFGI